MSAVRLPAIPRCDAVDDPQSADEVAVDAAINRMWLEFTKAAPARRVELAMLLCAARKFFNGLRAERVARICSQRNGI